MIVAFWAAVGKVALKVLQFLVGDKKGRKFLGYVIGIVLFIVLIPVIAMYGLFGWMGAGDVADIVGYAVSKEKHSKNIFSKPIAKSYKKVYNIPTTK